MSNIFVTGFDDLLNFFRGVKSPSATSLISNLEALSTQAETAAPQIAADVANAGLDLLGPWAPAAQAVVDPILIHAVVKLLSRHSNPAVAAQMVAQQIQAPA